MFDNRVLRKNVRLNVASVFSELDFMLEGCRKENPYLKFFFDKECDDSLTNKPDFSNKYCEIYVGMGDFYSGISNDTVSAYSFLKLAKTIFHEMGHACQYDKLGSYVLEKPVLFPKSFMKESLADIIIEDSIPEYMVGTYHDCPKEQYAELWGINHFIKYCRNSDYIRSNNIDYEGLLIEAISTAPLWYAERPVRSVRGALKSLEKGLDKHPFECSINKSAMLKGIDLMSGYVAKKPSLFGSVLGDKDLMSLFNVADNMRDLMKVMALCIDGVDRGSYQVLMSLAPNVSDYLTVTKDSDFSHRVVDDSNIKYDDAVDYSKDF